MAEAQELTLAVVGDEQLVVHALLQAFDVMQGPEHAAHQGAARAGQRVEEAHLHVWKGVEGCEWPVQPGGSIVVEQQPELGPMPSYVSVLRFMKSHGLFKRPRRGPVHSPGAQAAEHVHPPGLGTQGSGGFFHSPRCRLLVPSAVLATAKLDDTQVKGLTSAQLGALTTTQVGAIETTEARIVLAPVVRQLSDRDRRIVHLRFFDERTQQEIADSVGLTQAQVHVSDDELDRLLDLNAEGAFAALPGFETVGVSELLDTFWATDPEWLAKAPPIDLQAVDTDDLHAKIAQHGERLAACAHCSEEHRGAEPEAQRSERPRRHFGERNLHRRPVEAPGERQAGEQPPQSRVSHKSPFAGM